MSDDHIVRQYPDEYYTTAAQQNGNIPDGVSGDGDMDMTLEDLLRAGPDPSDGMIDWDDDGADEAADEAGTDDLPAHASLALRSAVQDTAETLLRWGIMPVPVDPLTKGITRRGWEAERYSFDDLHQFLGAVNVGARLGDIREGEQVYTDRFADADLDCPEAVITANFFLPETGMVWGRPGHPRSHRGYCIKDAATAEAKTVQNFTDPTHPVNPKTRKLDATICELRFSGQTVMPGSRVRQESGIIETVRWERGGKHPPAEVAYADLVWGLTLTYISALVARYWEAGKRHLMALPLAGVLFRGGLPEAAAVQFMQAICKAADETGDDTANRVQCITDTYAKARNNEPFTATPKLGELLDPKIVTVIRKRLHLKEQEVLGDTGPDGLPLSEIGNAEWFVQRYAGRVLHCDDTAEWYVYDGVCWRVDRCNEIVRLSRELVDD